MDKVPGPFLNPAGLIKRTLAGVFCLLIIVGCGGRGEVREEIPTLALPAAVVKTATAPAATKPPAPAPTDADSARPGWKRVKLPSGELSIELPEGWKAFGEEYGKEGARWSADEGKTTFGFRRAKVQPGVEVEASLLAQNAVASDPMAVSGNGVSATRYMMKVYPRGGVPTKAPGKGTTSAAGELTAEPALTETVPGLVDSTAVSPKTPAANGEPMLKGYEIDTLVRRPDGKMVYCLYLAFPVGEDAGKFEALAQQILESVTWVEGK